MLVDYWKAFETRFKDALEATTDQDFTEAWKSQTSRTKFYVSNLLTKVASSLGLKLRTELFKVDYAFCETSSDCVLVPLIFVESENSVNTAEHEIHKLCALSCPLKILIICAEWNDEPGAWRHGGCKTRYIAAWSKIIRAHGAVWPQPCLYGIIVAEWNTSLRYYSVCLNAFGEAREEHKVFFEKHVGSSGGVES